MKTIILKVQIRVVDISSLDEILNKLETPITDKYGNTINHLQERGYEVMILDRNDK